MEQLDYYMRRIIWKKDPAAYLDVNSFVFPFDKIKAGAGIILYGMGKMGAAFYQQLKRTRYCRLVAWTDRNPDQIEDKTVSVIRIFPHQIIEYQYDYIIIAIQNSMIAEEVKKKLSTRGIPEQKIIRM
jgi:FlaA1/EpsC-like NDP-sugar epimerase